MSDQISTFSFRRKPRRPARRQAPASGWIGRSVVPIWDAAADVLRPFTLAELAAIESHRPTPTPAA